jgi:hypothetical protein
MYKLTKKEYSIPIIKKIKAKFHILNSDEWYVALINDFREFDNIKLNFNLDHIVMSIKLNNAHLNLKTAFEFYNNIFEIHRDMIEVQYDLELSEAEIIEIDLQKKYAIRLGNQND